MVKVLWFSPYEILPAQEEELRRIYGKDVEIEKVNRRFESKEHFLRYVKESGAEVVYAPLPPDVLKEFKETEIGKNITWLMCEWGEIKDGVRREEEEGFDPNSDYARYAYGIGLHRRFLGFKEFIDYELKARELSEIKEIKEERKYLSREEYREKWRNIYRELNKEYRANKVYVRVSNGYIHVRMDKNCQMNDELRPKLKDMGFKFNRDYKEWYRVADEKTAEILKEIRERVEIGLENITVRVLQKYREPEWKAREIMSRLNGMEKGYRESVKMEIPKEKPREEREIPPRKRAVERKDPLQEFLSKTPADIEEENAKRYEEYEARVKPLKERLEVLSKEFKNAPYRSEERRQIRKEIEGIKKEIEAIRNEYQERAFQEGVKLREMLKGYILSNYKAKDERTVDEVIDELFIAMTDRAYLEKTWDMKNEEILRHITEEYEKEGELVKRGIEEEQEEGEEMEMGA